MKIRINVNSLKNAMGTVFLLVAAFFVCSTLVSMRSVFADPIAQQNNQMVYKGRQSPRTLSRNTEKSTVSRSTVSRAGGATAQQKTTVSRGVGTRSVSQRSITPSRTKTTNTRTVAARSKSSSSRKDAKSSRAVRARTSKSTTSRVGTTGSVMTGTRATSYTYLANKLYTGSYSNIVDSSTGLIAADAYSNCMDAYYTCMDEICTARSDTKGRCSCAGRVVNFLDAEEALEKANEELIVLSGQLSLLISTKGKGKDLASAFSLTEAEQVMNCVSWKELVAQYGTDYSKTEVKEWCDAHGMYSDSDCKQPDYCTTNNYGFDIKNIDGSSSDILAQLKAWADAKDLAKKYNENNTSGLQISTENISSAVASVINNYNGLSSSDTSIDKLANKWGYELFEYAHNNVCGRVLDSCFNGIYEACGTPPKVTDSDNKSHSKCANGATSNCPYNYNSYISVTKTDNQIGDVKLNERGVTGNDSTTSATCFGYTTSSTLSSTTQRVSSSNTSTDPYATLRGPVADARRSIMQKYLLDSNAACDVYGDALKQTAQNISYQKIAAQQALQQKRLEFKQEDEDKRFADARSAIDNFNECISEIWDCYADYAEEENWTTARIKAYCAQVSQVPHCYEQMICSPLQTQLVAVVDVTDNDRCNIVDNNGEYVYEGKDACRNVVSISEILYGTGADNGDVIKPQNIMSNLTGNKSKGIREGCLREALGCGEGSSYADEGGCLREWKKTNRTDILTTSGN